ncbi:hypothetical protein [Nocardia paucivorans]|uniref:hypothetical protein n=1 Tax=Nocardia paucivorans TaxID=114259 RepID=UPI0002DD462A|nr:hypothetical protein [Nocardia paucivorans]
MRVTAGSPAGQHSAVGRGCRLVRACREDAGPVGAMIDSVAVAVAVAVAGVGAGVGVGVGVGDDRVRR